MLRWIVLSITVALVAGASPAEARHRHHHHYHHQQHLTMRASAVDPGCNKIFPCEGVSTSPLGERVAKAMGGFGSPTPVYAHAHEAATIVGGRPPGCPHAFCGCGASLYKWGRIIPELNLAWNWALKFPRIPASEAGNGDAAVRPGHIAIVLANLGNGDYKLYDANSGGHQTRIHTRHLVGYVFVRPTA